MHKPNPSVTTNRLHFEDLEPRRFEELGYQLLHRLYKWNRFDHTGVCGNDGGVDLYGITKDGIHCYCQVKRYTLTLVIKEYRRYKEDG